MVENAPCFSEIATEIETMLHGCILVAHNARFDYGFLKNHLKRCNLKPIYLADRYTKYANLMVPFALIVIICVFYN